MGTALIVLAGVPGTGKTTLARGVVTKLRAAYLRVDAAETAIAEVEPGVANGVAGYAVIHALAAENLALSIPVVVGAVNPVPEARGGWQVLANRTGSDLSFLETFVADEAEHEARVRARKPDLPGHIVPTWEEVQQWPYAPWDEGRDGLRHRIDMTNGEAGLDGMA